MDMYFHTYNPSEESMEWQRPDTVYTSDTVYTVCYILVFIYIYMAT